MVLQQQKRAFYQWNDEQNEIWSLLYKRQFPRLPKYAHSLWLEGHDILQLEEDVIPSGERLDALFQEKIDWELVSTDVQYSDGATWFNHLVEQKFLITEYIREKDSLDYTPLPDIFHDIFGHLPLHINKRYADLTKEYAKLLLECPRDVERGLGTIWWYTIEFGLMKEDGEVKAFGTGLMSSYEELNLAYSDKMERRPFNPVGMAQHVKSPHEFHKILWVMEDLEQLEEFVAQQRQLFRISY